MGHSPLGLKPIDDVSSYYRGRRDVIVLIMPYRRHWRVSADIAPTCHPGTPERLSQTPAYICRPILLQTRYERWSRVRRRDRAWMLATQSRPLLMRATLTAFRSCSGGPDYRVRLLFLASTGSHNRPHQPIALKYGWDQGLVAVRAQPRFALASREGRVERPRPISLAFLMKRPSLIELCHRGRGFTTPVFWL